MHELVANNEMKPIRGQAFKPCVEPKLCWTERPLLIITLCIILSGYHTRLIMFIWHVVAISPRTLVPYSSRQHIWLHYVYRFVCGRRCCVPCFNILKFTFYDNVYIRRKFSLQRWSDNVSSYLLGRLSQGGWGSHQACDSQSLRRWMVARFWRASHGLNLAQGALVL